jgi:hypothetical protein
LSALGTRPRNNADREMEAASKAERTSTIDRCQAKGAA